MGPAETTGRFGLVLWLCEALRSQASSRRERMRTFSALRHLTT